MTSPAPDEHSSPATSNDGASPTEFTPFAPPGSGEPDEAAAPSFDPPNVRQPAIILSAPGSPPPGYVAFDQRRPLHLESTNGLRIATLVLFGVVVLTNVIATSAAFDRKGVFDDAVAGRANFVELQDADERVAAVGMLNLAAVVVAGIVLSIWSLRAARNLQVMGAENVSTGWACGGWYIPIGNMWLPWMSLRRGFKSIGLDVGSLNGWHALWIASTVFAIAIQGSLDTSGSPSEVSRALAMEGAYGAAQTCALVVAVFLAAKATGRAEAAFAERRA